MARTQWKKYVLALVVTAAIFATAFYAADRFSAARINDVRATENQIAIDILSNETQYDLLSEQSCSDIAGGETLSDALNSLAARLSYAEENLGSKNPEVIVLKKQYSLLEIKDYLLMEKITARCGTHPVSVLYFYSNEGTCADCSREGDVLTYLRETYPLLRVYSFDYDLDLSAMQTLVKIHRVQNNLPALIVNGTTYYGFKDVADVEKLIPHIDKLKAATTTTTLY